MTEPDPYQDLARVELHALHLEAQLRRAHASAALERRRKVRWRLVALVAMVLLVLLNVAPAFVGWWLR